MSSLSEEAHANLIHKRGDMHKIHMDRLQKQGLQQHVYTAPQYNIADADPPEPQEPDQLATQTEEHQSAGEEEEGPSRTAQFVQGAKHVAKNYAWPFTRDILAPATGDLAVNLTKGAAWLVGKSVWGLADVIWALNGGDGNAPPPEAEGCADRRPARAP